MNNSVKIFKFKVAVGITFQKLRLAKIIDTKSMTQQSLNDEISIKYNKTWNSAREESLPNTTIENLYIICDYFNLSLGQFFKLVYSIPNKEIEDTIKNKKKLSRLYKNL
tara:strand:+ start:25215 stop:25541 length:327 start_codon:yes stop_codon:yes gene_type:complete